jgi:hypothetical protein
MFTKKPCTILYQRKPFDISLSRLVPLGPWYTDGTRRFAVCSQTKSHATHEKKMATP